MKYEITINIIFVIILLVAGIFLGMYIKEYPEVEPTVCGSCDVFCPEKICPEIPKCPEIPEQIDCIEKIIDYKQTIKDMEKILED